ncbi:putative metalloprotease CJM1_0395 family protein [Fusibacter ferrireducens]|uniref:Uncharacterized protein n=1 Tax=Fusibacter ferrireducens TaxID=2785058 RepID=A0ABS0A0C4_9FIRM|nr:putative metalloprotease CJM1_0395 family protein [Fusibacter ferrireducens]MBF4696111.1 hypothetical protein [Fusibacter ferrireducens]
MHIDSNNYPISIQKNLKNYIAEKSKVEENLTTDNEVLFEKNEKFKTKDIAFVKLSSSDDFRIKKQIQDMQNWERHVKNHELAHSIVGGGNVGSASYIYAYGPDGKKYIIGGQVSVSIPNGLTLDSISELERLKLATAASSDSSPQDLISAGIISAEVRARSQLVNMKRAIEKYETQMSDKALTRIKEGQEIFVHKKINFHSARLLDLFV